MTKEEFLDSYQKCSDAIRVAEDNLLNLKGKYLGEKVQELDAAFPYGTMGNRPIGTTFTVTAIMSIEKI